MRYRLYTCLYHDVFVFSPTLEGVGFTICFTIHNTMTTICFTICLCISPDLDGNRGTKKKKHCAPRDPQRVLICFTICLFISPDLDGQRAPKINPATLCPDHLKTMMHCGLVLIDSTPTEHSNPSSLWFWRSGGNPCIGMRRCI
jgi:hypothetical protein